MKVSPPRWERGTTKSSLEKKFIEREREMTLIEGECHGVWVLTAKFDDHKKTNDPAEGATQRARYCDATSGPPG